MPVDEVITIVLFHREDEPLVRLVLDDAERAEIDRLWDELRFVSQDALKIYQSFDLMLGFASQEGRASDLIPLQKAAAARAEAFGSRLIESEPKQIDSLIRLADRAYRRPLTTDEDAELRGLYRRLRHEKLSHDEAFRLTLARVLVAPAFLYRVEQPGPGGGASPVSDWEIAGRLSYFLWASMPDDELRRLAGSGRLRDPDVLAIRPAGSSATTAPGPWPPSSPASGSRSATSTSSTRRASGTSRRSRPSAATSTSRP